MSCFLAIDLIGLDSATYGQDSGVCTHVRVYRVVVAEVVVGSAGGAICTFPGKRASGLFFALTLLPRTVTRLPHKLLPVTLSTRILGEMADPSQKYPELIAFNLKRIQIWTHKFAQRC